jgi:uncharacterized protein YecT (DUF1311 family)
MLLCVSVALAQDSPTAHRGNRDHSDTAQARYRKQGADALAKEQARSKANLCADADTLKGGNARIAQCLADQAKQTDQDYLTYIRAIGGLLRPSSAEKSAQKRLPFDSAEDAWQTYRDKSCTSVATQWEGGDQAPVAHSDCRLKLTWKHMDELADLYSDLWH